MFLNYTAGAIMPAILLVKGLQFLCGFDAQTEREGKDRQNMPVIHVIHIASGVESAKAICSG
jgi:hypothetical protein